MLEVLGETVDDLAEGGEGLVDVLEFVEVRLVDFLVLVDLLGASQVAEVDFGFVELALAVGLAGLDQDLEDGVRPAALQVHAGLPDVAVPLSPLHQCEAVVVVRDRILAQSFHVDAVQPALVDLQWFRLLVVLQQVVDLLVVDLQERAVHELLLLLPHHPEDVVDRPRDHAGVINVVLDVPVDERGLVVDLDVICEAIRGLVLPIGSEHGVGLPY